MKGKVEMTIEMKVLNLIFQINIVYTVIHQIEGKQWLHYITIVLQKHANAQ